LDKYAMPQANVNDSISELGAGVLNEKRVHTLSDVALGTSIHDQGNKRKVTLEFTFSQTDSESDQVKISHKMGHATPTNRGKKTEENTTIKTFFVGKGGVLTIDAPKEENSDQKNAALILTIESVREVNSQSIAYESL
jgi:hypothetical protein